MDEMNHEPRRDPRLADALRRAEPAPPLEAVDWDAMRARLAARAELPLAARRAETRGRARPRWLMPFAAAASVAVALLAGRLAMGPRADAGSPGPVAVDTARPAAVPSLDELVEGALPESVDAAISGQADADALLLAAVGTLDS
jgi:hypothetical protein